MESPDPVVGGGGGGETKKHTKEDYFSLTVFLSLAPEEPLLLSLDIDNRLRLPIFLFYRDNHCI